MAWSSNKRSLKAKRVAPKRTINWERWGLGASPKDRPTAPIEEIRRQGLALAGRVMGQGARARRSPQDGTNAAADRPVEAVRPGRRGAGR